MNILRHGCSSVRLYQAKGLQAHLFRHETLDFAFFERLDNASFR